jgi:hypothetical protein
LGLLIRPFSPKPPRPAQCKLRIKDLWISWTVQGGEYENENEYEYEMTQSSSLCDAWFSLHWLKVYGDKVFGEKCSRGLKSGWMTYRLKIPGYRFFDIGIR